MFFSTRSAQLNSFRTKSWFKIKIQVIFGLAFSDLCSVKYLKYTTQFCTTKVVIETTIYGIGTKQLF